MAFFLFSAASLGGILVIITNAAEQGQKESLLQKLSIKKEKKHGSEMHTHRVTPKWFPFHTLMAISIE